MICISKCILQVGWGKPTMIELEALLFKATLEDTNNKIFILVSDRFLSSFVNVKV